MNIYIPNDLGFMLLCTTNFFLSIDGKKKEFDFVKITFHLNENIEI
jgi:hypothetical protein